MDERTMQRRRVFRRPVIPKKVYVIAVVSGLIMSAAALLLCNYSLAFTVKLNDTQIAQGADRDEIESILEAAEREISGILGYTYNLEDKVSIDSTLVSKKSTPDNAQAIKENIYEAIDEIGMQFVVTVDGEEVGCVPGVNELDSAIERKLDSSEGEATVFAAFSADIDYEYKYASTGNVLDQEALDSVLSDIPVETVEEVTYTIETPYKIEYLLSDKIYNEDWETGQNGSRGESEITALVTYLDGEEQEREILSEEIITEPVTAVVYVGTAEPGTPLVTGNFIWPADGSISSQFGNRRVSIGSSNHKGIDISCPSGQPIYASDGGTVVLAGRSSGYGNLIKIEHENGIVTYYAHCSSLEVSEGDVVAQGQEIATVGMTGTATGYHLHFEIRLGDQAVNPMNYLP